MIFSWPPFKISFYLSLSSIRTLNNIHALMFAAYEEPGVQYYIMENLVACLLDNTIL